MFFLFFMVPLPQSLVNLVAFPLQLIAADFAVETLHLLHIPALREGNIIHLADTQLFVAEACAGLRSLMALGALAVVFAYFFRKNPIERVIIVASAIPIAIFVNAFRVALTGYLAHRMGAAAAQGLIHRTEGFLTFGWHSGCCSSKRGCFRSCFGRAAVGGGRTQEGANDDQAVCRIGVSGTQLLHLPLSRDRPGISGPRELRGFPRSAGKLELPESAS